MISAKAVIGLLFAISSISYNGANCKDMTTLAEIILPGSD